MNEDFLNLIAKGKNCLFAFSKGALTLADNLSAPEEQANCWQV